MYSLKNNIIIIILLLSVYFFIPQSLLSQNWTLQYSGTTKKLNSISVSEYMAWVCGDSGTVLKTTNGGTNWLNLTGNGIPVTLKLFNVFSHKSFASYFNELRYVYVTGTDNSGSYIYMTSNSGTNWSLVLTITGAGAKLNSVWFKDTLNGFAAGEPMGGRWQLWKTTNRGVNWDSAGLYLNGLNYSGFANNMCGKYNSNDSILYLGANYNGSESRYYRSSNFGRNWSLITTGINRPMTSIYFLRVSSGNFEKGMLGGNKYFSLSSNGGNNWSSYDSLTFSSTQVCTVSDGYSSPSFLLKTDSLGWQTVYYGWTNYFYSNFSGIRGMNHINGFDWRVYLVGDSGKIYYRGILYPLVKNDENILPDKFSLSQNYPNPFNPNTIIRFKIKDLRFVTLKVYDILGNEIASLINEKLQAGIYEIPFSVSQFSNNHLSSGVYFYKLQAGDFTETKKMLMIK